MTARHGRQEPLLPNDAAEAQERFNVALKAMVPHWPTFTPDGCLHCSCRWWLPDGGKLDWWAHVEEQGGKAAMTDDAATLAQRATARPWEEQLRSAIRATILTEDDKRNALGLFDSILHRHGLLREQAEAERDEALGLLREGAAFRPFFDGEREWVRTVAAFLRRHDAQPGGE